MHNRQSKDLARIDFSEYASNLLTYLWRAHDGASQGVRLSMDFEPVTLSATAAVPCGLILNELATNSLKHAFRGRGGGQVTVSLRTQGSGLVCLSVRDDGTGMPAGLDWRHASSLGLRIVLMLAGQLGAAVDVQNDGGTEFVVTFQAETRRRNSGPFWPTAAQPFN